MYDLAVAVTRTSREECMNSDRSYLKSILKHQIVMSKDPEIILIIQYSFDTDRNVHKRYYLYRNGRRTIFSILCFTGGCALEK